MMYNIDEDVRDADWPKRTVDRIADFLEERARSVEIEECDGDAACEECGCEENVQESESDGYSPPAGARGNARKVLAWKKKHGDQVRGMTRVGWARASQLARGGKVSRETVGRMAAFARHRKNSKVDPKYKSEPWRDAGYVAWLGWGGDTGVQWAAGIVARESRVIDGIPSLMESDECGAGSPGGKGFEPGNSCAKGSNGGDESRPSRITRDDAAYLVDKIKRDGGFTYDPVDDLSPSSGYAVAYYDDAEEIHDVETITEDDVYSYLDKHREKFRDRRSHVGGWVSEGKVYLDISLVIPDRSEAEKIGIEKNQYAIFDLGSFTEIEVESERTIQRRKEKEDVGKEK